MLLYYICGQFHRDPRDKIRIFSTLRTCSGRISSDELRLCCPVPLMKHWLPSCGSFFCVAFAVSGREERDLRDIFWQKMSRGSRSFFFSEFVVAAGGGFAWW